MESFETEPKMLWSESAERREEFVKTHQRTHNIPGRGIIRTPEIEAERAAWQESAK